MPMAHTAAAANTAGLRNLRQIRFIVPPGCISGEAVFYLAEDETITENPAAPVIQYADVDTSENTQPEQLSFQFGFDKSELSDEDKWRQWPAIKAVKHDNLYFIHF